MSKESAGLLKMPCPFCGKEPSILPVPEAFQITTKLIACKNQECPVRPKVQDVTLGKALSKWNTRQGCVDIAKVILGMYSLGKKAKKLVEG